MKIVLCKKSISFKGRILSSAKMGVIDDLKAEKVMNLAARFCRTLTLDR